MKSTDNALTPGHVLLSALATLMPQRLKHFVYTRIFGWYVHPSAVIGLSLILGRDVHIDEGVVIGHFNLLQCAGKLHLEPHSGVLTGNVLKGCEEIRLCHDAALGWFNWVSGPELGRDIYPSSPDRRPVFHLGAQSRVVRSHRFDCSDSVWIGEYVVFAGVETHVMTHTIDLIHNRMLTQGVVIDDYSHIGSRVTIQANAHIAPKTAVAPGSVVHGHTGEPEQLIGGVPARPIKPLHGAASFSRTVGQIV